MTCKNSAVDQPAPPHCTSLEIEARFRTAWVRYIAGLVRAWIERRRQRDALRELDAHLLKDIGLTRQQARGEAEKPFWLA